MRRLVQGRLPNLRNPRFWCMAVADALLFSAAFLLAYFFRFDFDPPQRYLNQALELLKYVLPIKLGVFLAFGLYRGMWRYTGLDDAFRLLRASLAQSLVLLTFVLFRFTFTGVPRSVFLIDWLLTIFLTSGLRVSIRSMFTLRGQVASGGPRKPALIIGAGSAGERLIREMDAAPGMAWRAVGFLDDDPAKAGRSIHGRSVLGTADDLADVAAARDVAAVFIAVNRASGEQMRRLVELCEAWGGEYKVMPALGEIMDGRVSVSALREVDYTDLLGREPVALDDAGIRDCVAGRVVLVTGCGGTIGSELCRQLVRYGPARLVLVDAGEYNLHQICAELRWELDYTDYVQVLGSVANTALMDRVFAEHAPAVVFHAAAYKHVPLVEEHPWQAVWNNVVGTRTVMQAAVKSGVERFVVVSTDKAVRPTNVMGATKRVTELLMRTLSGRGTRFMAVRFGNVVGSSGSVVPLFRRQIERGGPVTVTHPEVTRYFMAIPEAAQLILQAGAMGEGGEVFVLDMGVPVRIADMAEDLIRLSGKEPGRDIEVVFTGLRPGEKLYEELITEGEGVVRTEHEKIMVLAREGGPADAGETAHIQAGVAELQAAAERFDAAAVRAALRALVPEYHPQGDG